MTNKEAIVELESLIEHCEAQKEHKHHEPWESDVEALNQAIAALKIVDRLQKSGVTVCTQDLELVNVVEWAEKELNK